MAPILQRRCIGCHNGSDPQGDLSLEDWDAIQQSGVVEPGDPDSSTLLAMISPQGDEQPEMPKDSDPLATAEVGAIRAWIAAGAEWPSRFSLQVSEVTDTNWWSLLPIKRPAVPKIERAAAWIHSPIDAFVMRRLRENGIEPSASADRRTIIRRLYYDLIGLPPSPTVVEAFVADQSPQAYEALVDRLLASPHYGERWARHWLDVVHYGDTHGYDKDKLRPNAWPYRDYVIRALNNDTPYGRFVEEQLAGDVLFPGEPRLIAATGFIAAGPWDFIGHVEVPATKADGRIARNLDRDDMVVNTIHTFCSMTAGCARCHNHKFDPITQEDYYSLQAVFAAIGRNDRPFDMDADTASTRAALVADQATLAERRTELTEIIERAGGRALTKIDRRIADLDARRDAGNSASNGYHSQFAPEHDTLKWVQVDLGSSQLIDRIRLVPARPTDFKDTPGFGFPVRFKLEISDDAEFDSSQMVTDQTAADYTNPGDAARDYEFRIAAARYVRLTATSLWDRGGLQHALALAEMQIVGGGKNLALAANVSASDSIDAGRWHKKFLIDGYSSRALLPSEAKGVSSMAADEADRAALTALRKERQTLLGNLVRREIVRELAEVEAGLKLADRELAKLPKPQLVYAAATHFEPAGGHQPSRGEPLPIFVLQRGMIDRHLRPVEPGTLRLPGALPSRFMLPENHGEGDRRVALANWIIDPHNPLTWRSIVNRIWLYHFGRGIVDSPSDLGRMGQQPSHPELLDWLAAEFRDGGDSITTPQSIKALHKLLVTSSTYRQAVSHDEAAAIVDSGNQYYWRANRRRLEAEAIRDTVLLVAGKLQKKMYGPGFQDFVLEQTAHSPQFVYEKHDPDDIASHRRSVYRFLPRSQPQPFMETLDCADPSQQVAKRDETLTPLSALALLNNRFMVRMAEHFAARLETEFADRGDQIDLAFHLALSRRPQPGERSALLAYAQKQGLSSACRVIMNLNEFVFVD